MSDEYMKRLVITEGYLGYKKPILWVEEGNERIKIASFNDKESVDLFMQWCKEWGTYMKDFNQ